MLDGSILVLAGVVGWLSLMVILVRKGRTPTAVLSLGLLLISITWTAIILLVVANGEPGVDYSRTRAIVVAAIPLALALGVPLAAAALPERSDDAETELVET